MAGSSSFNNVPSNTLAYAIDFDEYSGSESEFGPEGNAEPTSDTDNLNPDDPESGSLSPASAARVEEISRELKAIRKSKGKGWARPLGQHLFTFSTSIH